MDDPAYHRAGWSMIAGGDVRTRDLVRGALRDGRTTDARVDVLLREWLHRWRLRRWLLLVSAAVAVGVAVWTDDPGLGAVLAAGGACMLLAALVAERTARRLRGYRGMVAEESPA
ncbi:hypothetical protein ACFFWC_19660 [Plantactinospora siamensis]|uniref:DUF3040 domain-containing protein n=1 Tax=Plantactinospora siamensis TaxID=555372 RepID=A0ABV6P446_9ACTN